MSDLGELFLGALALVRKNTGNTLSSRRRERIRPAVNSLDSLVAHGLSCFFRRPTKQIDRGLFFHEPHCKLVYKQ